MQGHNIFPEDVEFVCHADPVVLQGQQKKRLVLIGPTEENQILAIVLETKGNGRCYPITAYQADSSDIALYKRLKGGVDDEE